MDIWSRVRVVKVRAPATALADRGAVQWGEVGAFKGRLDPADPVQGCLGNCYLIGAMVALAHVNPRLLRLRALSGSGARVEASFASLKGGPSTKVVVGDRVPVLENTKSPLYARGSRARTSWPALLEKAYASWRTGAGDRPDYQPIIGGDCLEAMQELSGQLIGERRLADGAIDWLESLCPDGRAAVPIMAWTFPSGRYTGPNLTAGHAYAVLGVFRSRHRTQYVVLRNPFARRDQTDSNIAPATVLSPRWRRIYSRDKGTVVVTAGKFQQLFHGVAALCPD
jgi:hypothetical protein